MLTIYILVLFISSSHSLIQPVTYRIYNRMFLEDQNSQSPNGLYITDPSILGLKYSRAMVPLNHIDYQIQIVNSLAHITLKQEYQNFSNKFLNVYFSLPINPKSAIYKMVAQFGRNIVQGVVKEKKQARRQFQEAKRAGKQAALTEIDSNSKDIIRMNIGNIPPEIKVTITISFVQEMSLSLSTFYRLQIPSTISPRFMNSVPLSEVKMNQLDKPLMVDPNTRLSKRPGFTWNFNIILKASRKIVFYNSTTHKLKKIFQNEDEKQIQLGLGEQSLPNKDFVFIYTTQDFQKPSYVIGSNAKSTSILVSFIPKFVQISDLSQPFKSTQELQPEIDLDSIKGQFVFILDRSGSMDDETKIQKAKSALIIFLRSLPIDSYFNIISFGDQFSPMFSTSERYQNSKIKQAISQIQKMSANFGGTQIYHPLDFVLSQDSIHGYPKYVFLLTDGQVQNTESVIRMAKRKSRKAIINSIGIGNGASLALIEGTAEAGRGKYVMITEDENPSKKIIDLLKSALTPLISRLNLKYNKQLVQDIIPNPEKIAYIRKDDNTNLYLILKQKLKQKTIVNLQYEDPIGGKIYSQDIEINPSDNQYAFVDKMAHFKVLRTLEAIADNQDNQLVDFMIYNKYSNQNPIKRECQLYSIEHQILSPYTSFIAVVKQISDQDNKIYKQIGTYSIQISQPVPIEFQPTISPQLMIKLLPKLIDTPISHHIVAVEEINTMDMPVIEVLQQPIQIHAIFQSPAPQPPPIYQPSPSEPISEEVQVQPTMQQIPSFDQNLLGSSRIIFNPNQIRPQESTNKKIDTKPKYDMVSLVSAQNIDGSWSDEAIIKGILEQCGCKPKFNLQELKKQILPDILYTKIVLIYIQKLNPGDEYSLILKKSQSWLKKALIVTKTNEDLLNEVKFD